jgi:hypothetical protein
MPIPTMRMASDREKLVGVATLKPQVEIETAAVTGAGKWLRKD